MPAVWTPHVAIVTADGDLPQRVLRGVRLSVDPVPGLKFVSRNINLVL